ncbi:hypothetical protein niasHS_010788 [Heterodera schachtii]|uniref:GYF domain-containing protein n=1 Tax=Heterodera schachtii TaxID=97005 RepID=A0ABD2IUJ0_HETSC
MGDLRSHCKKWLYVGKQDDHEYGPYTSTEMLHWLNNSYFDGSLRLRTTNDNRFYTLSEWIQACGNEIPFALDVHSMESLRSAANSRNYRGIQPTIDSVHNHQQVDPFLPRSAIPPASTVENADFERHPIPLGMPIQLLPTSQKTPPSSQQVLLMSAQPTPNQPLVLPVSSVPTFQFVQQHMFPSMSQQQPLMPIRLQPSSMLHHQINQQAEHSQQDGTVSDSPDSGHVVTPSSYPLQQIGNGIDCIDLTHHRHSERMGSDAMEGSWKRGMLANGTAKMVDNWTSMRDDSAYFQQSKGTQTDDISVKVSQEDAERLLFQLLGVRIRINFATEK